jgi:DNA-binding HxlR family transcriptional regulator
MSRRAVAGESAGDVVVASSVPRENWATFSITDNKEATVVARAPRSVGARTRPKAGGHSVSRPRAAIRRSASRSGTALPIMQLLDLLSRRWSLRVIWELRRDALTSRALLVACGDLSPTVLQSRLTELRRAKLVDLVDLGPRGGYELTAQGRELLKLFLPLHFFADRWAKQLPG